MSVFLKCAFFSFCLALPIGVGSIKMLQNGLSRSPIHTFWTGTGLNVVDICMFALYYFGLSYIFKIHEVQILIYFVGIFVLGNLAYGCFEKPKITIKDNVKTIYINWFQSLKDGIFIALTPSSILYWCSLYGNLLTKHMDDFFIACAGILFGFFLNNWFYTTVSFLIRKFANQTIIKWVNIVSGLILTCFTLYFVYQLFLILL